MGAGQSLSVCEVTVQKAGPCGRTEREGLSPWGVDGRLLGGSVFLSSMCGFSAWKRRFPVCALAVGAPHGPCSFSVLSSLLGFRPGPWPLVPAGLHGAHRAPSGGGVEDRQPRLEGGFSFENRLRSASSRHGRRTGMALRFGVCSSGG